MALVILALAVIVRGQSAPKPLPVAPVAETPLT
jgi:hypothetical protein